MAQIDDFFFEANRVVGITDEALRPEEKQVLVLAAQSITEALAYATNYGLL